MAGMKHEKVVRRYYEKTSSGDLSGIEDLLGRDFVLRSPISDEPIRGADGFKQMIALYKAGAPDFKIQVEDITENGDTVSVRWRARFKHTGDFRGRPPTGKSGEITGSDTIRISGDKIVEVTNNLDLEAAEKQVGFKPVLKGDA